MQVIFGGSHEHAGENCSISESGGITPSPSASADRIQGANRDASGSIRWCSTRMFRIPPATTR